jgi:hypothetical protein
VLTSDGGVNSANAEANLTFNGSLLTVTGTTYIEGGSADWNETTPGTSNGTIHLDPGSATDNFGNAITFGASDASSGTNAQAGIYIRSDGTYGTKMYIATTDAYVSGAQTRIYIGHDGRVGMGTISPVSRLDVNGTLSLAGYNFGVNSGNYNILYTQAGTAGIYLGGSGDAGNYYDNTNHYFRSINGGTNFAYINSTGLGVGTTSPGHRLVVSGSSQVATSLAVGLITPSATVGRIDASNDIVAFSTSDYRLKTDVTQIQNAIEKIKSINGINFTWIENTKIHGNSGKDVGVIAQEIEKILPEVVTTRNNGYKAVKYEKIIPLLIEAIKEQQREIDSLKKILF